MVDMFLDMALTSLRSLAGMAIQQLGWSGICCLVAGLLLLLAVSARLLKLLCSPRGMAFMAAITLAGLALLFHKPQSTAAAGNSASTGIVMEAGHSYRYICPQCMGMPLVVCTATSAKTPLTCSFCGGVTDSEVALPCMLSREEIAAQFFVDGEFCVLTCSNCKAQSEFIALGNRRYPNVKCLKCNNMMVTELSVSRRVTPTEKARRLDMLRRGEKPPGELYYWEENVSKGKAPGSPSIL
jgi:hypothetical protein